MLKFIKDHLPFFGKKVTYHSDKSMKTVEFEKTEYHLSKKEAIPVCINWNNKPVIIGALIQKITQCSECKMPPTPNNYTEGETIQHPVRHSFGGIMSAKHYKKLLTEQEKD